MKSKSSTIRKRIVKDKELIIEQLKKTPIVSLAAEKTGISRATYYRWKKSDKRFEKLSDDAIAEGVLLVNDIAESQLLSLIRNGNLTGIIFWLKHHHPTYETRIEVRQALSLVNENLNKKQMEATEKALEFFGANEKYMIEGDGNIE